MNFILIFTLIEACVGFGVIKIQDGGPKSMEDSGTYFLPNICDTCECDKRTINCQNKGLTSSNYTWPEWKNLEVLLDFNFFSRLTKFPVINVTKLSISSNRIRTMDSNTFENLKFLVELNLKNNYLTELHSEIFSGQYDGEHYRPIKYLRILDLSHNLINSLQNDLFLHLPNLEILNLSCNPLKLIDDGARMALSKLPFIKVLDLSYTGIEELPEYFLHNSHYLKVLNLEGNNITETPQKFIEDGHQFVSINLAKNPIKILEEKRSR